MANKFKRKSFLGQNIFDDVPVDVGEAHVSRRKAKGTFGVVDAKKVKHGGVKVVDLHLVFDGFVSPFVGRTVGDSGVYATAREPGGEAEGVVVAAVSSLSERGTPEFAGPDDEGFLEEAEFFQVGDKSRDRLIDRFTVFVVTIDKVAVLVPAITVSAGARQFDEANPSLDEAASKKALLAEGFGLIKIGL
jgi:hypothetical protein